MVFEMCNLEIWEHDKKVCQNGTSVISLDTTAKQLYWHSKKIVSHFWGGPGGCSLKPSCDLC